MSHKFINKEEGYWLIKCAETKGSFSTALWANGKIEKQKCPCCGETIERRG